MRIILRHMLPSFLSYIIANLTLNIPNMILAETGLSFIGLGLRPPAISWGVLLQEAMNLRSLVLAPWVLTPGIAVVISVLAFNFVGDGLRDAADPYGR
jgi:peptide/nickel transport system permease protein